MFSRHFFLTVILLFSCLFLSAQEGEKYIVHSSGKILTVGNENRAVIKNNTSSSVKKLTLTKQTNGTYLISTEADGVTLYLSLDTSDGWSTFFLDDNTTNRARYTIETSGQFVKLKNAQTGKYLGTDDTSDGASVFSDKSGSDAKHLWMLSDTKTVTILPDTLSYPIAADAHKQTMEGWGVSLCWWAGQCGKWSDTMISRIVDWMTSRNGLNWNIFRYNIGGGDDPENRNCNAHHMDYGKGHRAEMEGFQDERNGAYLWERDAAQRKIMLEIKKKRPDAIFEAFSNSAPWWMTESGCVSGHADGGKDNLRKDYYQDFANYLVDVCKFYQEEHGITFRTLEPFNEAMSSYWHQGGTQEGCHFDASSQVAFLKVLSPVLKASGLSTGISASDETNVGMALGAMQAMENDGIGKDVVQYNTHTYGADNVSRSKFGSLTRAIGKRCWMSETGSGGSGLGGNLSMLQRLFDDVRYICPEAWVDWQYMEENNDQWCVINGSFAGATATKNKNYYVRQQVTRFIPAGHTIVASLSDKSLAAINPTSDTLTIVLLNTEAVEAYHNIALPLAHINGSIKAWRTSETESLKAFSTTASLKTIIKEQTDSTLLVMLPKVSVTTMQIPVSMVTSYNEDLIDGDTYLIVPQSDSQRAVSLQQSKICLSDIDASDPAQQWTVEKTASGSCRLRNGLGKYAVGTTSYDMTLSTSGNNSAQLFDVEKVDGIYSRILWHTNKSRGWDLNNAMTQSGTKVGLYPYGNSVDASHRNFMFVRIATTHPNGNEDGIEETIATTPKPSTSSHCYTLSGCQVERNKLQRGIYIIDGKKVVVR